MTSLDIQIKLQGTIISRINNAAKASVREFMDNNVLPAAREMAPKRTGENAASLSTMTRQRGSKIQAFIRSNSGHGGYDEKGTAKMAARPYMKPAFDQSLTALNGILKTRFEQLDELGQMIEDGGIQGLEVAVKEKKFKSGPMSKASKANRANSKYYEQRAAFAKAHGGRQFEGPARPKRKYTRKTK